MRQVTIAGGGLAGLSLGIALRNRGVPVALHEAGRYPRHRVCGEFISGVSAETLQKLGIEDLLEDANRLRATKWFLGGRQVLASVLPVAALGISRHRLDQRLAAKFEALGGDLHVGSRAKRAGTAGDVWAAGRPVERKSDWLGLKVHVRGVERAADLEMHVGKGGYVGLAPVENGAVNVCGLFRRQDVTGKGPDLLGSYLERIGLRELAGRIREGECDAKSFVGVSAFRLGRQVDGGEECVLGDAESMIPPFTGNGMSMAFEAAETAVDPMERWAGGDADWDETKEAIRLGLEDRFRRRLFTARLLHPLLLSAFGRTLFAVAAGTGVLPFRPLLRLLR